MKPQNYKFCLTTQSDGLFFLLIILLMPAFLTLWSKLILREPGTAFLLFREFGIERLDTFIFSVFLALLVTLIGYHRQVKSVFNSMINYLDTLPQDANGFYCTRLYPILCRIELFYKKIALPSFPIKVMLLCVALIFAMTVQFGPYISANYERHIPTEADDSYGYLLKSKMLIDCFNLTCKASRDLLKESAYVEDDNIRFVRSRLYHRVFYQYHLLYSVIVLSLHEMGLTWEQSYLTMAVSGGLFIYAAIGIFMVAIFGWGAAVLSTILISVTNFYGHGIRYVVPSNLSLAIALLTWSMLVFKINLRFPALPVAAMLMILMHPIGYLYAGVSCIFFTAMEWRSWSRKVSVCVITTLIIIVCIFVITRLADPPYADAPSDWPRYVLGSTANMIEENSRFALKLTNIWTSMYGGWFVAFCLVVIGVLQSLFFNRMKAILAFVVLALLVIGSIIYPLEGYKGTLFERTWVPFVFVLSGFIGGLPMIFRHIQSAEAIRLRLPLAISMVAKFHTVNLLAAITVVIIIVAVTPIESSYANVSNDWMQRKMRLIHRHDFEFDSDQPVDLFAKTLNEEINVLYWSEPVMYFYLLNGGLNAGAVYVPAVKGTPLYEGSVRNNNSLTHTVMWNPVKQGRLLLDRQVTVSLPMHISMNEVVVGLRSKCSVKTKINIQMSDTKMSSRELIIRPNEIRWEKIQLYTEQPTELILLSNKPCMDKIALIGVRVGAKNRLNWPWDEDIIIKVVGPNGKSKEYEFKKAQLLPSLDRNFKIINDSGSIVLAKFIKNGE